MLLPKKNSYKEFLCPFGLFTSKKGQAIIEVA